MVFRGSSDPHIVALSDDAIVDAVEELALELESFAFERERVLAKLDIRSATQARSVARDLRLVVSRIPLSKDKVAREAVLEKLGEHLGSSHSILEGERNLALGRPADGGPPLSISRDVKTTPPPISEIRDSDPGGSGLDYDEVPETLAGDADPPADLVGGEPIRRLSAQSTAAVTDATAPGDAGDASADGAPESRKTLAPPSDGLPYFGDEEGENDFNEETVARKVCWERSGNRVLGR